MVGGVCSASTMSGTVRSIVRSLARKTLHQTRKNNARNKARGEPVDQNLKACVLDKALTTSWHVEPTENSRNTDGLHGLYSWCSDRAVAPPGLLSGVLILKFEALGGLRSVPCFPDPKEEPEAVLRKALLWPIALRKDLLSEMPDDDKNAAGFE